MSEEISYSSWLSSIFAFLCMIIYFIQNFNDVFLSYESFVGFFISMFAVGISSVISFYFLFFIVFDWKKKKLRKEGK